MLDRNTIRGAGEGHLYVFNALDKFWEIPESASIFIET